jgi:predicted DNA-binding protein
VKPRKASGKNIPESQRSTVAVKLRLPPEVAEALDELADRLGLTRAGTVSMLLDAYVDGGPEMPLDAP